MNITSQPICLDEEDAPQSSSEEPSYLEELNPQQRTAVLHTKGPLMIVAGLLFL